MFKQMNINKQTKLFDEYSNFLIVIRYSYVNCLFILLSLYYDNKIFVAFDVTLYWNVIREVLFLQVIRMYLFVACESRFFVNKIAVNFTVLGGT